LQDATALISWERRWRGWLARPANRRGNRKAPRRRYRNLSVAAYIAHDRAQAGRLIAQSKMVLAKPHLLGGLPQLCFFVWHSYEKGCNRYYKETL